jgi:hypothetical protein
MSFCDRLEAYFRERPDQWIDGRDLAKVAGAYAWRSRCSDLRIARNLDIQNRVRWIKTPTGIKVRVSEYRFVPKGQMQLLMEQ